MKQQQAQDLYKGALRHLELISDTITKLDFLDNTTTTLQEFSEIWGKDSALVTATQISNNDSQIVARNKILLEGYHVLSELGAWIGGRESTTYSVVVTSTIAGVDQKFSWNEMTFEQFSDMVDFSGVGPYGYSSKKLVIKDSATLLSQFQDTVQGWGTRRSEAYKTFDRAVRELTEDGYGNKLTWKQRKGRKIRATKWQNVKKGNTLEAFLRYEQLQQNPNLTEQQRLFLAMNNTMSKPSAFYQGGDIGNIQIKGDYATVAQTQTIINELRNAEAMLISLISQLLSTTTSDGNIKNIGTNISADVSKGLEEEIQKLMQKFISDIIR